MTGCAPRFPTGNSEAGVIGYLAHETKPRLNYVLWLQDILSRSSPQEQPTTSIRGIDM